MPDSTQRLRVLLTGATGRIGTVFRAYVGDRYALRLGIHPSEALLDPYPYEQVALEIADLDACQAACAGIDIVVHLAAVTSGRTGFYEGLLDANIKGVYNILRAAKDQGCRRAVVASSVQAVEGYPLDVQVRTSDAPRPLNMYAVSKAFAEATCHYFAASEGLSCIAVRVGSFEADWVERDPNARNLTTFISQRDMSALLVRAIEVPDVPFAIVHGLSDNRYKRLDMTDTQTLLDYEPQDDSFRLFGVDLRYTDRWYKPTPARPHGRKR